MSTYLEAGAIPAHSFLFTTKTVPLSFYQALASVGILHFYQYSEPLTETLQLLDFLND